MDKKGSTVRQPRLSVVSLDDKTIVDSIFREIQQTTAGHQDLRRRIFRQVAKSTRLQHLFLDALSRDAEAQKMVLQELAENAQLKGRLVVAAHEQQKPKKASTSRKSSRNS